MFPEKIRFKARSFTSTTESKRRTITCPHGGSFTFVGSVFFAIVYWFVYHEFRVADLPLAAYATELEKASGDEMSEELLLASVEDPNAVAGGKQVFVTHCAVCHEPDGRGKIGPNLTDEYWLHGGAPMDLHTVVKNGILTKGMPAWGATLGSTAVKNVTAFVLSIRDTNVAGGKEPQGDVWTPGSQQAEPEEEGPSNTAPEGDGKPEGSARGPLGEEKSGGG